MKELVLAVGITIMACFSGFIGYLIGHYDGRISMKNEAKEKEKDQTK